MTEWAILFDSMYNINIMTIYSNNKYLKLNDYANLSSIYHHIVCTYKNEYSTNTYSNP